MDATFTSVLFSPLGDRKNAAAVRRLAELAERTGAVLTLFGVVAEPSRLQRAIHRKADVDALLEAERDATAKRLARWVPESDGIDCRTEVATGDPAFTIIERVIDEGHDLVVVTTDDDDEDHATIKRLMRKCPCPVWVIRPSRARTHRVLAAVNPDPGEAELNHRILELAGGLYRRRGGELHLVHAWELYGEATLRSSAFIRTPAAEVDAMVERERAHHHSALEVMLESSGLADLPWQIHLEKGPADMVIQAVVAHRRINFLVMGTVARTGVAGLIMGNTAENVLDHVRCSVMAVKPPGFVSPLAAGRAAG